MGRLVDDLLMLAQFDQDRPLDRQPGRPVQHRGARRSWPPA